MSLVILIIALAQCIHLLSPQDFRHVDTVEIMKELDDELLYYNIFKVALTWNDIIKNNIAITNELHADLGRVAKSIIVGLGLLVAAFVLLGIDYYLII